MKHNLRFRIIRAAWAAHAFFVLFTSSLITTQVQAQVVKCTNISPQDLHTMSLEPS